MKKNKGTKKASKSKLISRIPSADLADIRDNVVETISDGFDLVGTEFTRARKSKAARNAAWVVGGAAAGVAIAYFLDREAGSRRRSAIGEKFTSLKQGITDVAGQQLGGWRGNVREFFAHGLSAVKANFMNKDEQGEVEAESDSSPRTNRTNSKNYSGYQENSYTEQ
jgi:hypothetical protein